MSARKRPSDGIDGDGIDGDETADAGRPSAMRKTSTPSIQVPPMPTGNVEAVQLREAWSALRTEMESGASSDSPMYGIRLTLPVTSRDEQVNLRRSLRNLFDKASRTQGLLGLGVATHRQHQRDTIVLLATAPMPKGNEGKPAPLANADIGKSTRGRTQFYSARHDPLIRVLVAPRACSLSL